MKNLLSHVGFMLMLTATALLATGCASGPKYSAVEKNIPTLASGKGRIYFYRSGSMFGSGIQPSVKLNGEKVGDSKPGGFFYIDRAPGDYEVMLSTEVDRKLTFTLDAGEERYVRMSVSLGVLVYRVYPELVDKSTGVTEMRELSYTGVPLAEK
jgi:Protein of unknown function (DUF2846)